MKRCYRPVMLKWLHVMVSPVGVKLHHQIDFKFVVFLALHQNKSPVYPQPKNQWPSNLRSPTISGDAPKRPFRTVADWARPHTPLTLDPRSKVGTSTVTTLPEIWFPQLLKGDSKKKTGPFVMICKDSWLLWLDWHVKGILTHWFAYRHKNCCFSCGR